MEVTTLANGRHMQAIVIKTDGDQMTARQLREDLLGGDWPKDCMQIYTPVEIHEAIHEAGIVGLGGAAFPTHVKILPDDNKPIDTLLVNGCECEPYLTADQRLMEEAPEPVITGALLASLGARPDPFFHRLVQRLFRQAQGFLGVIAKGGAHTTGLHHHHINAKGGEFHAQGV